MEESFPGATALLIDGARRVGKIYVAEEFAKRNILLDKLNVNEGMLMEKVVAQTLRGNGHRLYFYSRIDTHDRKNHMEIDFLISAHRKIQLVEGKSSAYRRHSSLDKFMNKFGNRLGERYILYPKDVIVRDGVTHLPIYMAMFL